MSTLTPKQEMFCLEYLKDLNATQAAIRAGYSEKTANRIATENLSKLVIQQRIAELKEERQSELQIDAKHVLKRLVDIDQLDVLDIVNEDGTIKPIKQWSKDWRKSISDISVIQTETQTITKIKLPDKLKNLELLGKHIQVSAFSENVKVSDPNGNRFVIEVKDQQTKEDLENIAK